MRVALAFAVIALFTFAIGGCTDEDLSVTAGEELQAHVTSLRESVAAGDAEDAHEKLAELRAALAEYEEQGDVSPERAASIREAADEVAERLALLSDDEETETVAAEEEPTDDDDGGATDDGGGSSGGGDGSGGGGDGSGGGGDDDSGNGGGPDGTPPGHGGDPPGQNRGGGGR